MILFPPTGLGETMSRFSNQVRFRKDLGHFLDKRRFLMKKNLKMCMSYSQRVWLSCWEFKLFFRKAESIAGQ